MSSNLGVSLKLPNAMSIKFFGHYVFTIAHVDVSVNKKEKIGVK